MRLIQEFYAAGLPSRTVGVLLSCVASLETTPEALDMLKTTQERIDRQIDDLVRSRDRLSTVIARARAADGCRPVA